MLRQLRHRVPGQLVRVLRRTAEVDLVAGVGGQGELGFAWELGQVLMRQGQRQVAYDLLAPIYGWFSEGFDTPDLRNARALLDDLT